MKHALVLLTLIALLLPFGMAMGDSNKYSNGVLDATRKATPQEKISVFVFLTDQVNLQQLDDSLFQQQVTRQVRHKTVIEQLRAVAARSQSAVQTAMDELVVSGDIEGYTPYWITNCFVVYGTASALDQLSNRSDVSRIELNFVAESIEPVPDNRQTLDSDANTPPAGVVAIHAPQVWYDLGITGEGALVGDLDTGADVAHPALSSRWRGQFAPHAECWRSPATGSALPTDENDHGTHTCGTMVGACAGGTFDTTGVAPGALWIADDAINVSSSQALINAVTDGFQWFADPDEDPNTVVDAPDVVNNSWGVNATFSGFLDCDSRWDNVIIACEAAGTVCVFAAGNEGPNAQTLRSPANAVYDSVSFFAVGAVNAGTGGFPYAIADFSSRGPSDCNTAIIKPEVCAPGVNVYSTIPGGGYDGTWDGTSMATPHVAGLVALMRSANPNAEVRTIKSIIMRTARDEGAAGKDNQYGWGFIDAYEAVQQVLAAHFGRVMGNVLDATTNTPLQATVSVVGGSQVTTSNGTGHYTLLLPADSVYTLRYTLDGYFSQDILVNISIDDTTTQNVSLLARPVTVVFTENFETGATGWGHSSPEGWIDQWHVSTERSMNGTHAYKCGDSLTANYANLLDSRLTSPVLPNLPPESRLTFFYQINAERSGTYADSAYDGGILEVSADNGAFTQVTPTPNYNRTFRYRTGGGAASGPMLGLHCWSDSIATWTRSIVDLSAFSGSDVQLRWRFGSDVATTKKGWYIDSVLVTALGTSIVNDPSGLTLWVSGNNVILRWHDDANPAYKIYSSSTPDEEPVLEGSTVEHTFTVINGATTAKRFFYVQGWNGIED